MDTVLKDKIILVTGGTGSIGSNLVNELIKYNPKIIRVLDNNESALHDLSIKKQDHTNMRYFIGDIRDMDRLVMAMKNVDYVFHAAALKHVPMCEYNPFEAVKTNIVGTQNVIEAALQNNVDKVITISTDKAAAPLNVMGATKLLAEKLTISGNMYKGDRRTTFSCVRFGNVIGSRGSVIPVFEKQIIQNGEINLTNPEMTRFVMKIDEAVALVINAAIISRGGEIFVLDMPSLKLSDLANCIVDLVSQKIIRSPEDVGIKIIGRREGEKDHEKLITEDEFLNSNLYKYNNYFVVLSKFISSRYPDTNKFYQTEGETIDVFDERFSSISSNYLTPEEINELIKEEILD